ncbi:hypothetical protein M378DRAFT_17028 [Amanita muscaria Koide BX008]|uniref:CCHC-type domain-containing protein n=1 Tax=Amanita muscaria (strain Koide BX008) TaxID=946122 RepID=A0A0C2WK30_AMAMK|nr:hypothetical protein M378DRAFT_17028 [Amanita muscaria Koide BX008]
MVSISIKTLQITSDSPPALPSTIRGWQNEGRLYFDKEEIYFDHDTHRWRSREGNNPLPDEQFLGPSYVPGNPEEALPEHLSVVGPINPGTVFSANTESSDEEGTSGTDNALEYISADQEEDAELEQQEEGNQSETHLETVVPPTPLNLELLQREPPVVPIATTETPDIEMSQAPPQNNYQGGGGGGGAKLPLPEDFTGVRSTCTGFLTSIRAYFNFYLNQFTSDAQKITLALMSCKGAASTWRDSEFAKFDTDPVSHGTWNKFRTRFINQWEEVSAMASAMIKIQKLKLGGKYNMTQLISRFDELILYKTTSQRRFTSSTSSPTTYDEARKYATEFSLAYDRIDADNGKRPRYGTAGNDNYGRHQQRDPNAMDVNAINFEEGTSIRFTKLSPSQVEDYKKQGKCFNCGQKGHMSRMCPTKKKSNGGHFQKGGWKGKGKPSQSIHSAETEEEPTEEIEEKDRPVEDSSIEVSRFRINLLVNFALRLLQNGVELVLYDTLQKVDWDHDHCFEYVHKDQDRTHLARPFLSSAGYRPPILDRTTEELRECLISQNNVLQRCSKLQTKLEQETCALTAILPLAFKELPKLEWSKECYLERRPMSRTPRLPFLPPP